MATLYTKADLRNQALTALTVLDPTESPDADTIARVDPIIQQVIEGLDDENCLIFDPSTTVDTAVIPARVMLALKELVEVELGPGYGRSKTKTEQDQDRRMALKRLRRSILQGNDPIPVLAEYF